MPDMQSEDKKIISIYQNKGISEMEDEFINCLKEFREEMLPLHFLAILSWYYVRMIEEICDEDFMKKAAAEMLEDFKYVKKQRESNHGA